MEEIVMVYILKKFDDAVKSTSFSLTDKIFMVDDVYVKYLVKIFSIDETLAVACLGKIADNLNLKLFLLNIDTIIKDIENKNLPQDEIRTLAKSLIEASRDLKNIVVRQQQYEKAAKLRDIELKLMKAYDIKKEDLNPL